MKKILLIDDDEIFLKTVNDSLRAKDYEVITAKDGREGLQITKKERPDLILLDVLMPDIGGMEFLKIIKANKELNKIPVLIVSNFTGMNYVEEGIRLGAHGYIIKSEESLKTITDTIESIIGNTTT
ncbi:MAG: response regulator [bacterium]|nr:response regulator [bacterium]